MLVHPSATAANTHLFPSVEILVYSSGARLHRQYDVARTRPGGTFQERQTASWCRFRLRFPNDSAKYPPLFEVGANYTAESELMVANGGPLPMMVVWLTFLMPCRPVTQIHPFIVHHGYTLASTNPGLQRDLLHLFPL